jgi:hypothetical protein
MIFDVAVATASGQQRRNAAQLDGSQSFQNLNGPAGIVSAKTSLGCR